MLFTFQFNRNLKPEDWKDMDQVPQLHQLLKDLFQWRMDNKRFNLSSHWAELGASFQRSRLPEEREARIRENQATIQAIEEQLTQTGHSSFQEKTRIQGQKQDLFQPKAERVRPNDPEAVGLGERSTKEPEIVVHNSRISSPINRNITPTQTEHNVVTPESNLNRDKIWLQMSQFAVQTQESLDYFKRINERLQRNAILQEATIQGIQESCAQLSKASEETNRRLNQVFEEQHHCKRDRDFLDQDLNKFFNVYQNMKPQPEGYALENPYHQEDIKPDALLVNKARSKFKYQDGDNTSYSEKEALNSFQRPQDGPNSLKQENMIIWSAFIIFMDSSLIYQAYQTTGLLLELIKNSKNMLEFGIQK
ncbi:hypothetical protein O181_065280 [Austropuccinia psidii MF-1]|uniref:Uncharacterized protein n=1 Tax=Austropuccinia psidii MF-1 TaxID=1389203 RepID=A0A9Q3I3Y2_9BASI|nr:hypothetical protein [Austropuccinia psidii MF-1]